MTSDTIVSRYFERPSRCPTVSVTARTGALPMTKRANRAFLNWAGGSPVRVSSMSRQAPYHRSFERKAGPSGPCAGQGQSTPGPPLCRSHRKNTPRPTRWMPPCWHAWGHCWSSRRARHAAIFSIDLKDLHMAREALVKNRTAARNRGKEPDPAHPQAFRTPSNSSRSSDRSAPSKRRS